jgi:hypothetical protein
VVTRQLDTDNEYLGIVDCNNSVTSNATEGPQRVGPEVIYRCGRLRQPALQRRRP